MTDDYNLPDFRRPDPGDPVAALEQVDIQPDLHVGKVAPDFDLQNVSLPDRAPGLRDRLQPQLAPLDADEEVGMGEVRLAVGETLLDSVADLRG